MSHEQTTPGALQHSWWKRLLHLLNGPQPLPSSFGIAQSVFFRGMALIYLIAFVSWWVQVDGLVGSGGIMPAGNFVAAVKEAGAGFFQAPMIFHLGIGDGWLNGVCAAGAICSVLVVAGLLPGPLLLVTWFLYLSLVQTGSVFMSFQWDILLLESGLLAVIFAPWRVWVGPRRIYPAAASRWAVFLLWFLLFRLMFFSGILKVASDANWRTGAALGFHYETQPIPHVLAWYAHQAPRWFQAASSWLMMFIEIALPFVIFMGRRPRVLAAVGTIGLMILIMGTGNYTYFNLLTILLCVPLLDDSRWPERVRIWFQAGEPTATAPPWWRHLWLWGGRSLRGVTGGALCLVALLVSQNQLIHEARWLSGPVLPGTAALARLQAVMQPFHAVGGYGLFRVMTTERPEILIEGSQDGRNWALYEFRWKPDDPEEAPPFVAPHQPRLDWQMWFAALGYQYQRSPRTIWFENLMVRIMQGQPEVLALLQTNPFPEAPPRYLRARLFRYRFTDSTEKAETGHWWKREELGLYFPVVERRGP